MKSSLLSDLLGGLDAIVWTAEPKTLAITHITDSAVRLLGHPREVWTRPGVWERVLVPAERETLLAAWHAAADERKERHTVHRVVAADGSRHWFSTRVRALCRADGTVRRLVGVMTDVSEPLLADREIHEHETLRRLVLDQLPTIAYTTDMDLRFTSGAGAGLHRLGLRPDQLVGVSLYQYFQTDDPNHPEIERHRRALTGESFVFETKWLGNDYHVVLQPFRDGSGNIIGTLGVALDVTETRRAESAWAESDARLTLVARSMSDMISVLGTDGDVLYASPSHARILPRKSARLEGRRIDEVFDPADRVSILAALDRACRDGSARVVARACAEGRTRWFDVVIDRVEYMGREALVLSARDVTEQRALSGQLERSQRFEALGRLASGVAHDFNTIIAVVSGSAEILARQLPSDHESQEVIANVKDAAQDAAEVTRALLSFSREQAAIGARSDPAEALRRIVALLPRLMTHDVTITAEIEEGLPELPLARVQFEQIALNLATNARDAMPDGGLLQFTLRRHENGVRLTARDTGTGMTEETRARLFEPYFTTKPEGQGTGLGLATCYGIVTQIGGHIDVESAVGAGSTFIVDIPAADRNGTSGARTAVNAGAHTTA